METASASFTQLGNASKRVAQRLVTIGENRAELLMVELQEEREHFFRAILMALGMAAFGLLAGVAFTVALVVAFWDHYPIVVMFALAAIYLTAAALIYARLIQLQKGWRTLPDTVDQLKKDRECLEQILN